jgi:uncharacterized membrane protein
MAAYAQQLAVNTFVRLFRARQFSHESWAFQKLVRNVKEIQELEFKEKQNNFTKRRGMQTLSVRN